MMNNILLNETFDFEFKARWKNGTRFVLNSAWQGGMTYSENIANTKYLRQMMERELELDVLRITGKYAESMERVECMVSFPPDDVDFEMLQRFFYYYGRKYRQNAIIFVDEYDTIWTLPSRPTSTYGSMGRLIRGKKFRYPYFEELVSTFMKQTYELNKVLIPAD